MATEAPAADARVLTAAEKRAARRARVLQGGESRLKLVTGQIASLKEPERAASSALDKEMDSALNELLGATDGAAVTRDCSEGGAATVQQDQERGRERDQEQQGGDHDGGDSSALRARVALRPDPAQRRREAALRRQKKEAIVEQLLAPAQSAPAAVSTAASSASAASGAVTTAPKPVKAAAATISRHALALKLQTLEEKAIVFVLLAAAVYLALTIDLRTIATDLDVRDQILISYQELLTQGLPLAAIRQQMEREQLATPVAQRIERLLASQALDADTPLSASLASRLLPNIWDVPAFFASLVARPPVLLCVLLVRLVVAALARGVHAALQLPDVKSPQDDDLGFVANLALASKPALKGYVIKVRKALDDVFVFLYVLLIGVALRAIWTAPVV